MHEFNYCPESGHLYHNDRLMEIVAPAAREAFTAAADAHGVNVMKPTEAPRRTLVLVASNQKQQPK